MQQGVPHWRGDGRVVHLKLTVQSLLETLHFLRHCQQVDRDVVVFTHAGLNQHSLSVVNGLGGTDAECESHIECAKHRTVSRVSVVARKVQVSVGSVR